METNSINIQKINISLPVFTTKLSDCEELNNYLKEVILEEQKKDPNGNESNVKAWHSSWDTHHKSMDYKPIIDLVMSCVEFIAKDFFNCTSKFKLFNFWVMIYEEGEYTVPHTHFPSTFACVYYVDVEEGCSPIVFENNLEVYPENGLLVIFPAVLKHEVPPTKGKRIAISMNIENDV